MSSSSALGFMPQTTFSLLRPRASSSELPATTTPKAAPSLRQPRRTTTSSNSPANPPPPPPAANVVSSPSKSLASSSKSSHNTLSSSLHSSTKSSKPFPSKQLPPPPPPPLPTGPNPEELRAANARAMRALAQKRNKAAGMDESCFVYKRGGRKHHAFPMSECPYPLAVDREALDLDVHDHNHLLLFTNSYSLMDWRNRPKPKRVLDLGCGNGAWIMSIATEWQDCKFTGFDIVPVHLDLKVVAPDIADRVEWVYGNFLTKPLPFEDNTFDYVHIKCISKGVPEDKWDPLLEEVCRVLVPGGAVEVKDEDIIFPYIEPLPARKPKVKPINTDPGRPRNLSAVTDDGGRAFPKIPENGKAPAGSTFSGSSVDDVNGFSSFSSATSSANDLLSPGADPFSSSNTSISPKEGKGMAPPSPISRSAFNSAVKMTPSLPSPAPPLPELPETSLIGVRVVDEPQKSATEDYARLERLFESVWERRFINMQPTRLLPSYLNTHFTKTSASPYIYRYMPPPRRRKRTRSYGPSLSSGESSTSRRPSDVGSSHAATPGEYPCPPPNGDGQDSQGLAPNPVIEQAQKERNALNSQLTIAIHLHRCLKGVLACKEAMWEELMISRGWTASTNPNTLRQGRSEFDKLMERYCVAAQARISLDDAIERGIGWRTPKKDPDFARMQQEVIGDLVVDESDWDSSEDRNSSLDSAARKAADEDDSKITGQAFRQARVFYAFKPMPDTHTKGHLRL